MDRTGRANGVYRRLKIAKQAEQIRAEPPPLPGNGPYRVIVADLPWPYEKRDDDPSQRGVRPYPTMSIARSARLPSPSIAAPECDSLAVDHQSSHARGVRGARCMGLRAKDDPHLGEGSVWATATGCAGRTGSHCLMAVRGKPIVTLTQSNNGAARAGARAFGEAGRVLRPGRIALPGAALRGSVLALPAQREVGLPRRRGTTPRDDPPDDPFHIPEFLLRVAP